MRRLFLSLLLIFPTLLVAQDARRAADWTDMSEAGCIGGSECPERRLRVPLLDRPVIAIRFTAHDAIGNTADGRLRIKIDGNTVRERLDIPRRGETFVIDVEELRGRVLTFEPASDDEVDIKSIGVLYARAGSQGRIERDNGAWGRGDDRGGNRDNRDNRGDDRGGNRGGNRAGWQSYPRAGTCIGGDECRKNGTRITIPLENAPVLGVRFYAHDNIGTRADGRLSVRIDSTTINSYIDAQRNGRRHEFDVENVTGSRLVIETTTNDEVEISDVEVLYGRRERGEGRFGGDTRHEGGCIGGNECGGRRARIRIRLRDLPVDKIRLYARDDIGARAGGELRIRIDDQIVRDYLDIPREGRTFEISGKGLVGEWLILEPAEDDEVVIRDVRITYGDEE